MDKKTIIITGASSGLGSALARQYASPHTRLFLFGRSQSRLKEIASICKTYQAEVVTIISDVRNKELTRSQIEEICEKYKVSILIACAGVSAGTLNKPETSKQVDIIFDTNINGNLNTIMPAIPFMVKNKAGTIVLISSMAGLLGLASAPSYSASKAAIKVFGDALRSYLKQFQVKVCVVIPGYIDTPMTTVNNFPMPFKISAAQAAKIIIQGIEANKGIIVFPKITYLILKLINLLPYQLIDYINSKLPGKPSFDE